MGQKINPNVMRLGINNMWSSTWYTSKKNFPFNIKNDFLVRSYIRKKLKKALVSKIVIERPSKSIRVTIYTARPGIVIGRKGEDVEKLRNEISLLSKVPCQVNIFEIRRPELDAYLVSINISIQLERRLMFRRVLKRAINNSMRMGAKGIKVELSGRLGGAEIARREWHREGRIPLHTLRSDIDYGFSQSFTTYGVIGVKVWIFKGEILDKLYLIKNSVKYNFFSLNNRRFSLKRKK